MGQRHGAGLKLLLPLVRLIDAINDDQLIGMNVFAHHLGHAAARIKIRRRRHAIPAQTVQVAQYVKRRLRAGPDLKTVSAPTAQGK